MHNRLSFFLVVFFLLFTIHPLADDLYLKNGRRVEGTFLGGDSRTVRFLLQDGQVGSFAITDVESIIFGTQAGSAASSAPAPAPTSTSTPVPADPYTVSHGTVLVVRMIDSIDSDVNKPGETFRATLEEPIVVGANILAPKDTPVTVQLVQVKQSGQLRGEAEIALQLRSLTLNGRSYSLASEFAQVASEGKGGESAKVIGTTAVIGALIGAIAGGKKGAAVGAAAGAGAGVVIQSVRGKQVRVPSEAVLTFSLEESVTLR
ncbi:MAG: hypothetical protein IH937_08820 [Acidobacteria bacterium]|nr:hypothetical protein [Acidobacteriota bacterium]